MADDTDTLTTAAPTPRALVLLSGGLDSVMALLWASQAYDVEAVSVHYGQRHFSELAAAWDITKAIGVPFETIELAAFSSIAPSRLTGRVAGSVVVPNRNSFLLSVAGAVAMARGIRRIVVGCNADDAADFPDCRARFLDAMQDVLSASCGHSVEILAPWLHLTKGEMLRSCLGFPGALEHARRSVSCYEGKRPGCGACSACVKRAAAFAFARVTQ
jgi:7-cyano-7-deazaguanine synthase